MDRERPNIEMKSYHETRLLYDERRNRLWKTLCEDYFQRFIGPEDCVLELGAGYWHFINHIRSRRRIAVDSWAGMTAYLQPGIEAHVCSVTELEMIENESVDFAFASNLFEHLRQEQFAQTLRGLTAKLKRRGTLNILQLNYRFAYREYFDDYTHVAVYSDRSLADFLSVNGFEVKECHARFLPLTIGSRMPVSAALIRLYLALPVRPMGKQMLLRAVRFDCRAARGCACPK